MRIQWTVNNPTYHVEIHVVTSLTGVRVQWTVNNLTYHAEILAVTSLTGVRVQWTVNNLTYHVEILAVTSLTGVRVQWTVMSSDIFPSPVQIVGHQVDEVNTSEIHTKPMLNLFIHDLGWLNY